MELQQVTSWLTTCIFLHALSALGADTSWVTMLELLVWNSIWLLWNGLSRFCFEKKFFTGSKVQSSAGWVPKVSPDSATGAKWRLGGQPWRNRSANA